MTDPIFRKHKHEVLFSATEKQIIQRNEMIIFTQPTNAMRKQNLSFKPNKK